MSPIASTARLPGKSKLLLSLLLLLPLNVVSQNVDSTTLITGAEAIAPSQVSTAILSDGQPTTTSEDIVPTSSPSPSEDEEPDATPSPWTGEDEAADSTPPPQSTHDPGQDEKPGSTPAPQSSHSPGQNEKPDVTPLPPPPPGQDEKPGQDAKPDTTPSPQPSHNPGGDEGRPKAPDGQGSSVPQPKATKLSQDGAPGLDRTNPTPPIAVPPQPSSSSGRNTAAPVVTNAATPSSPAGSRAPQVQEPSAPSQARGASGTGSVPSAFVGNTQASPIGSGAPAASGVPSGDDAPNATATDGVDATGTDAASGTANGGVDATGTSAAGPGTTPTDGAATTAGDNESPSEPSSTPAEFTGSSGRRAVGPGCGTFLGLLGLALAFC